jgi:DNA replication protein DnaC
MNDICIAKHHCKSAGQEICSHSCSFFVDLRYQIELASLPKKHQKAICSDLPDSFFGLDVFAKFTDGIADRIDKGTTGLYLYSRLTGTGKSTVACSIALEYIVAKLKQDYRTGKRTDQLVKFINVADFLEELRQGFNDEEKAKVALSVAQTLKQVPLVIMDDIGAEKVSEWTRERLLNIISDRYDSERTIIFTSNHSPQEIEMVLGGRVRSRIEGMSVPIEFKGNKDFRRKV